MSLSKIIGTRRIDSLFDGKIWWLSLNNVQKLSTFRKIIGSVLFLTDVIFFGACLTLLASGQYGAGLAILLVFVLPVTVGVLSVFRLINYRDRSFKQEHSPEMDPGLLSSTNKADIQEKGRDLSGAAPPMAQAPAPSQQRRSTPQSGNAGRSSRYEIGALVVHGGTVRKVLGRRKTSEGWAYDLE